MNIKFNIDKDIWKTFPEFEQY